MLLDLSGDDRSYPFSRGIYCRQCNRLKLSRRLVRSCGRYRKQLKLSRGLQCSFAGRLDPLLAHQLRKVDCRNPRQMLQFLRVIHKATRIMSLPNMPLLWGLRLTASMRKFLRIIALRKRQFFIMSEQFRTRISTEAKVRNSRSSSLPELEALSRNGHSAVDDGIISGWRAVIKARRSEVEQIRHTTWCERLEYCRFDIGSARARVQECAA